MKKIFLSAVIMAFVSISCDQKPKETTNDQMHNMNNGNKMMDDDSTMMHDKNNTMENHEERFACSMHPEVIGKKDDKCSICGMKLTVPVKSSENPE